MATSITFTDEWGAVTLTNGKPVPGDRFASWTPLVNTIGPEGGNPVGLGNGITYGWEHRVDFGAQFSLEHIPQAKLPDVQRLFLYLMRGETSLDTGGVVTVNTGDKGSNAYQCRIWPGFVPEPPELMDRQTIEYRITLQLLNATPNPFLMVCSYDVDVEPVS